MNIKTTPHSAPALAGETGTRVHFLSALRWLLIALPFISLFLSAWAWMRYGVDMPVYDDWRQYKANDMGRLDLAYLFTPHNDTLYTFGLLLDSLAFRLLDGNTVPYQLLSMIIVLGGILALSWKLLNHCFQNKTAVAVSFSAALLIVQPDTYWGWQNLAYHQALPLLCVLSILYLMLVSKSPLILKVIGAFALSAISGLSYISGAFASLSLSMVSILFGILSTSAIRKDVIRVGLAMLVPALATTAAQLWVILEVQHGTHRADAPMAFPWQLDFWMFTLGKIARSLILPITHPNISIIITFLVIFVAFAVSIKAAIKFKTATDVVDAKKALITISLLAVIFSYLLLIAAGRTNLRPENIKDPIDVFVLGFYRFHFFWVTLIWPWILGYIISWTLKWRTSNLFSFTLSITAICFWFLTFVLTPIISHDSFFKATMKQRSEGIACAVSELQRSGAVLCPSIELADITQAISNGRLAGASFSRLLPILPTPLGTNSPRPLYRLSEHVKDLKTNNIASLNDANGVIQIDALDDPSLEFNIESEKLRQCATVSISAAITVSENTAAQIFFTTPNEKSYSEANSTSIGVFARGEPQQISFLLNSKDGFGSSFRFDPVAMHQQFTVSDLELRCSSSKQN